jgi:hypothetical protein
MIFMPRCSAGVSAVHDSVGCEEALGTPNTSVARARADRYFGSHELTIGYAS